MKTTRTNSTAAPYLGADLTDRYAAGCKPVDICGLTPGTGDALNAEFWAWEWDSSGSPLDIRPLLPELSVGTTAMFDGPQGTRRPAGPDAGVRAVGRSGWEDAVRPSAD